MDSKKDHISVFVRIRPVLSQDNTSSTSLQIISKHPPVLLVTEKSQTYHFDNIFSEDVDQENVYNDAVQPFVEYVKKGYNCTVFTYGQTGTGKTYTMGSGSQKTKDQFEAGIIPRALKQLFDGDKVNNDDKIDVFVSFSEIYKERVFDLLQPEKKSPLPVSGFVVQGLSRKCVRNIVEANELLDLGNKIRHVGETRQNINSSRSHAVFTVYYTLKNSFQEISGKLNLVDLAGSESVRKTGNTGSTFVEGININKGLLSIGQVIYALSTNSGYIPYRQSMITSILQGSLNVDNYISLIACVSANPEDITETLQTLDFAQRAKKVRSNPEVNQVIAIYKKNNPVVLSSIKTPMKRPYSTPLKTPGNKKLTLPPLPLINESRQSQMSNVDNSIKSQFSINISAVSSGISPTTHITQEALSPVIKKYMTRMEASLMYRLETVLKTTLRQPSRTSVLTRQSNGKTEKKNTPQVHCNRIQNEVSKMVKNEIAQMTIKTVRATSSPIENKEKLPARRLLTYDSPSLEATNSVLQDQCPEDIFKIPQLLPERNKRRRPRISISPIENEIPKSIPTRSLRLSLQDQCPKDIFKIPQLLPERNKRRRPRISRSPIENEIPKSIPTRSLRLSLQNQCPKDIFKIPQLLPKRNKQRRPSRISISPIENGVPKPTPRRSLRLSLKETNNSGFNNMSDVFFDYSMNGRASRASTKNIKSLNDTISERSVNSSDDFDEGPFKFQASERTFPDKCARRPSARLVKKRNVSHYYCSPTGAYNKKCSIEFTNTPSKILVERALKKNKAKDSPYTAHSRKVLKILNQGNQKEVERLHTVGAKTAEQILLFRKLKGSFKGIEDLSKMPGWGTNKYEKFVVLNFLRK